MRPRARIVLLSATTALALAFALAVLLDRPSEGPPAASSSSAGVVPGVAARSTVSAEANAPSASGFYGAALPAGVRAHSFTLIDQSGRAVSLSHYRGQVVVLAFLYSTCGPTCIVIAQQIRGALGELSGAGGHPVAVLFLSADPAADTPTHVHNFLAQVSLTGRIHYLTGPLSQSAYCLVRLWHRPGELEPRGLQRLRLGLVDRPAWLRAGAVLRRTTHTRRPRPRHREAPDRLIP